MNIIKRIKKFQKERGWSAYQMGNETEINASTLSNWFNKSTKPTIENIEKLCIAFGITMSTFFNEYDKIETLTVEQSELLAQWNCLMKNEKADLLKFITTINKNRQEASKRRDKSNKKG